MSVAKQPKIIVLGIDGLEFNLVEEWKLINLMQKKFCKLNLSDFKVIVTPPIWGSMITGVVDKEIIELWTKYIKIIGNDEKLDEKTSTKILGKIIPDRIGGWIQNHLIQFFVGGNPFEITANYVKNKNQKTVFDLFKNSWTNGIPGFGKNVSDEEQRKLTVQAIAGNKKPYIEFISEKYYEDKALLLNAIKKQDYDFIFWYTPILDNFGHMGMGNPLKHMMKHYLEINNLVGDVIEKCPKSIIYIISDHGMERIEQKKNSWGAHSDHAFFSSNTGETIEKPPQLYKLISDHIID
jgi:hypothetical protein